MPALIVAGSGRSIGVCFFVCGVTVCSAVKNFCVDRPWPKAFCKGRRRVGACAARLWGWCSLKDYVEEGLESLVSVDVERECYDKE
jgi:hypothetical protein